MEEEEDTLPTCPGSFCIKEAVSMMTAASAELSQTARNVCGCRCLAAAIIERAILDLTKEPEIKRAAEVWLFERTTGICSLDWCTEAINVPIEQVRERARKELRKQLTSVKAKW